MKTSQLLDKWERKGIITAEQKEAMKADLVMASKESRSNKFTVIVSVLGVLLLGTGVIMFFASNWDGLGRVLKLILILLLPIIPLGAGYYLSEHRQNYPILGKSLIFLGNLLIGASIAMFFQLYNLDLNPAPIFLIWLILNLPFTFLIRSEALGALHTLLLLLWFNFQFIFVEHRWWGFQPDEETFAIIELILGAALLGVGNIIRSTTKNFSYIHRSYRRLGLFLVLGCGFIFTLGAYVEYVLDLDAGYRLLFNLLYIILLGGALTIGIFRKTKFVISQCFLWIGIYLISVYFDLFWDLMDRSIAFMALGILALVGGFYLERYRRRILKALHES